MQTSSEDFANENDDYSIRLSPNPVNFNNSNLQVTYFGNNSENKRLKLFDPKQIKNPSVKSLLYKIKIL